MSYGTASKTVFAAVGILLNATVSIAIFKQKNTNYTFKFMAILAIADLEYLLGFMTGSLKTLLGFDGGAGGTVKVIMEVTGMYFTEAGLRASECFLVLVALCRWLHFAKRHYLGTIFGGKKFLYTVVICFAVTHLVFIPPIIDVSIFEYFEGAAYMYTNMTYSRFLQTFDTSMNFGSLALQILFNVMSILWIVKLRKQVRTPELKAKHKREIMLFVQCILDSFVFFLAMFTYALCVFGGICEPLVFEVLQILVLLNCVDCAVFYLCFNRQLRTSIVNFLKTHLPCASGTTTVVTLSDRGVSDRTRGLADRSIQQPRRY